MCGISGAYWKYDKLNSIHLINESIKKLSHRGPNGNGIFEKKDISGKLYLAHTRLSIIDLSDFAKQPMSSHDGRYTIIFNGEIYNYLELKKQLINLEYIFYTNSDTEVLLYAWIHWGKKCLNFLNGMFSFVIFDSFQNSLFCARDGFGIKPFFYHFSNDSFFFASEIPSLLPFFNNQPELNNDQIFKYLTKGQYDDSTLTFFEGIYNLEPGHILIIELNTFNKKIEKWWDPKIKENHDINFENATEILRGMFLDNVKMNLRSDVPIGAALSGGIDSSAIVCAMRYLDPKLKIDTFSYISEDINYSEEPWIDLVNNYVGANVNKIKFNTTDLITDIDDLITTQCEPFGSTSIYAQYRVYKRAKEKGITVTLDGQGADELLAGYMGYPSSRLKSLIYNNNYIGAFKFIYNWNKWPGRNRSQSLNIILSALLNKKTKYIINKIKNKNNISWINYNYYDRENLRLVSDLNLSTINKDRELMAALRNDFTKGGLQSLLRHGDRNSMRWSIESRVPFLNNDIAEFVLSLPENFLIADNGQTKNLFRSAMKGIVPYEILERKDKIGFKTPEKLLINSLKNEINTSLQYLREVPLIKHDILFNSLKNNDFPNLWRVYNLSQFIKIYKK
jgi:asparagine synthase (glutamine-hydrolysing)